MTTWKWSLGVTAMLLAGAPIACGDDTTGSGGAGGTGEGGTADGGGGDGGDGADGGTGGTGGTGTGTSGPEICNNNVDDDMDGDLDCADSDCSADVASCWTCDPAWFDETSQMLPEVYCDCACGLLDPDCADPNAPVFGCDSPGSTCDASGMCVPPPPESDCDNDIDDNGDGLVDCADPSCNGEPGCAPTSWTCDPAWYDEDPADVMQIFCDCACGAPDPDCSQDPNAPVYGCMDGQICDSAGVCQAGSPENCSNGIDDDGDFATDCADTDCLGETGCAPVGWTCDPLAYDQAAPNEACDCECGVLDPDCSDPNNPFADCVTGETCNTTTLSCDLVTGEICDNNTDDDGDSLADCDDQECYTQPGCSPPGWVCNPSLYDEPTGSEGCDCNCGSYDPDCDTMGAPLYGCTSEYAVCNMTGQCEIVVPSEWTCPTPFFGANDGCDCGCGVTDPDCPDGLASSCMFCDEMGSCNTQMGCPGDIDPNDNAQCI